MNFPDDHAAASQQLRVLRNAASLLSSSLELDQTLANAISACLPSLGDFGFFDVVLDDGVRRTARAYHDPEIEAVLLTTRWARQDCTATNLCALSSGEPALHTDIGDDWYRNVATSEEHLALLRKLAFRSMLSVPVRFGHELVGALTLFMGRSGRRHSEADVEFASELASLAAPVVVNVRLLERQRASEAALRVSEERLRLATDAGKIGIWDWDIAADKVTWSDRVHELHGLQPGQFGGRAEDFSALVHPEDRDAVWKAIEQAIRDKDIFSTDFRTVLPDGSERWLSTWAHLYRDSKRTVTRLIGATIDITERKRVEERLRLLDTISLAARNAVDAKAVLEITTRILGEHLGVRRCAYADLEPDNDHFTIRHDWAVPGVASTVGKYSLDQFGPGVADDMRSGRTLVIRDMDAELAPHEGADTFNAIGIKAIICCPLVKERQLVAMMAVHHAVPRQWTQDDVTLVEEVVERSWAHIERVHATEALRKSEAHLMSLFGQTAAGIAETDLHGRYVSVNDRYCSIVGRSREELLGRYMQEFTLAEDLQHNLGLFGKAVHDGLTFDIEKRYVRPDGSLVWVNVNVARIRMDDPASDTMLAVVLDISERKRAEDKLREADRRKDEFLAMLAHELRNPLAPISAAADLLQVGRLDETRIMKTSEVIARQVRHLTDLVDDLLDVSRVTRGLATLEMSAVDIKRKVADAVEQVRPLIESRGHRLELHLPPEPAHAWADRKRVVQILVNLLNNAAKYTPEGGHIVLAMDVQAEQVALSVTDNGIGMTPELVERAFELFAQAERSADRSQGGLGIGLALVKSLVELHGGSVRAESAGLGKGSRFTVWLPRLEVPVTEAASPQGRGANEQPLRPLKVMVVDDNTDAATMLAMFLHSAGHQVVVEHSPVRALLRAQQEPPDVCVLDIGLPDMDGNELVRRLRAQPETAHALMIAVTGYGQEQDRESAAAAGFDYHFVKPADSDKLARLLHEVSLRGSSARA